MERSGTHPPHHTGEAGQLTTMSEANQSIEEDGDFTLIATPEGIILAEHVWMA